MEICMHGECRAKIIITEFENSLAGKNSDGPRAEFNVSGFYRTQNIDTSWKILCFLHYLLCHESCALLRFNLNSE